MKNRIIILASLFIGILLVSFYACQQLRSEPKADSTEATNSDNAQAGVRPLIAPTTVKYSKDSITAYFSTGESLFKESDPWLNPPGTNLLPNIYTNVLDTFGNEMVNTLPSTPTIPYNLHDGVPIVSAIDKTSPTDDLQSIFDDLSNLLCSSNSNQRCLENPITLQKINEKLSFGIDILEGNSIPNRVYSGFPLLHYNGPEKIKTVKPIFNEDGEVIGGNVDVKQIWYDSHIESNTGMLDFSAVMDVPWTITYHVNVLNRGADDFSPFAMFWDRDIRLTDEDGKATHKAHVAMDQSFFPMPEGTESIIKIKMPPGKYYNLVYTWGWRIHPPRIQVIEDRNKHFIDPADNELTRLDSIEIKIFGSNPTKNRQTKDFAISKISDLAPAKIMWNEFNATFEDVQKNNGDQAIDRISNALDAFEAWKDRTHLPNDDLIDTTADLTLLYVNNTIYGGFTDGGTIDFPEWRLRGDSVRVTLKNGDYFWHNYQNVDFGGARGWENQYKSSVRVGGSGCWFTFGRVWWWKNLGPNFVRIPEANPNDPLTPVVRKAHITFNYEPSRRLRFYQFDPMHHDVAIFSIH